MVLKLRFYIPKALWPLGLEQHRTILRIENVCYDVREDLNSFNTVNKTTIDDKKIWLYCQLNKGTFPGTTPDEAISN